MMNCAGEAATMSLYEYEERLYHWNEAHGTDEGGADLPSFEITKRAIDKANADPRLTH